MLVEDIVLYSSLEQLCRECVCKKHKHNVVNGSLKGYGLVLLLFAVPAIKFKAFDNYVFRKTRLFYKIL